MSSTATTVRLWFNSAVRTGVEAASALARSLVSSLPYRLRLALVRQVVNPLLIGALRRQGDRPSGVLSFEANGRTPSPALSSAVSALGADRVAEELDRVYRLCYPIPYALFLSGHDWSRHSEVVGYGTIQDRALTGRPVILVSPHVGAELALTFHLLRMGHHVTGLTRSPERFDVQRRFGVALADQRSLSRLRMIPLQRPTSVFECRRALMRGQVVVWHPDIFPEEQLARTDDGAAVQYLGRSMTMSRALPKLILDLDANVVLGHCRIDGVGVALTYEDVPVPDGSTADDVAQTVMSATERCILENIDQWRLLRTPHLAGLGQG